MNFSKEGTSRQLVKSNQGDSGTVSELWVDLNPSLNLPARLGN